MTFIEHVTAEIEAREAEIEAIVKDLRLKKRQLSSLKTFKAELLERQEAFENAEV